MPSENGEVLAKKVITFEQLGQFVVLSPRQLQRLVKDGIIHVARDKRGHQLRGRVVLCEALPKLFEYVRESSGDPAVARFRRARADMAQSQAEMARIELAAKRGEYIETSAIEEWALRTLTMFRARMLAIPSSIARSLIGLTDFRQIYQIVESAIHRPLNELADFGQTATEYESATTDEQRDELAGKLEAQRQRLLAFAGSK